MKAKLQAIDKNLLFIALLGFFTLFVNLDATYPDLMEARNLVTAREMLTHDHWWNTTLNLQARMEKPPLPTWMTAVAMIAFGQDHLGLLRLPSALGALLLCFFFYGLIKQLFKNKELAFIATVILQTSFLFVQMGRINTWDMYTHAFMVGGLYYLIRFLQSGSNYNAIGFAVFLVLSVYSKGPVSPYVLFLPFLMALFVSKYKVMLLKHGKAILMASLLGLILGFSWYISMYFFNDDQALKVVEKETVAWTTKHIRPFYFYLHFPIFCGIWCIPFLISLLSKRIRTYAQEIGDLKLTLSWLLITFVFLSVIPTKKERYLLPLLIPMALSTAYCIHYYIHKFKGDGFKGFKMALNINFYLLFSAFSFIAAFLHFSYIQEVHFVEHVLILALILIAIMGFANLLKSQRQKAFQFLLLSIALFMLLSYGKSIRYVEAYDDFVGIETLRSSQPFQENNFYAEDNEIDPRLIWLAGKPIQQLDWENNSTWPDSFLFFTYWDMKKHLEKAAEDEYTVEDLGQYHTVRRKVKWKAQIYHVKK